MFKPHVTVAYVRKGKGSEYAGDEAFVGEKFTVEELIYALMIQSANDAAIEVTGIDGLLIVVQQLVAGLCELHDLVSLALFFLLLACAFHRGQFGLFFQQKLQRTSTATSREPVGNIALFRQSRQIYNSQ